MAANPTKAQVAQRFAEAGVRDPRGALSPEELQKRLQQRAAVYADARAKERRSRAAAKKRAIRDFS